MIEILSFFFGVGAASQRLMFNGERFELLTRMATKRLIVRADEKLTAFLELEAAICACGESF